MVRTYIITLIIALALFGCNEGKESEFNLATEPGGAGSSWHDYGGALDIQFYTFNDDEA